MNRLVTSVFLANTRYAKLTAIIVLASHLIGQVTHGKIYSTEGLVMQVDIGALANYLLVFKAVLT